jgi:uncharacterized membrane protein YeiH
LAPERPQAPWSPVPLSELLILIGAIGAVIGLRRGSSHAGVLLVASIAAVAVGVLEMTLREHRAGYRSHALLLSVYAVIALHSTIVVVGHLSRSWNVILVPLDVGVAAFLFKRLRTQFAAAKRKRVLSS